MSKNNLRQELYELYHIRWEKTLAKGNRPSLSEALTPPPKSEFKPDQPAA